jgi:hypothetical protein
VPPNVAGCPQLFLERVLHPNLVRRIGFPEESLRASIHFVDSRPRRSRCQ